MNVASRPEPDAAPQMGRLPEIRRDPQMGRLPEIRRGPQMGRLPGIRRDPERADCQRSDAAPNGHGPKAAELLD